MTKPISISELTTERLLLRQWQPEDFVVFAQMNADAEVMQYFPQLLSKKTSNIIANKCQKLINENGWGFWAVSLKRGLENYSNPKELHSRKVDSNSSHFIGMVGLNKINSDMPFAPGVEIGWRLHKDFWRKGYALEAATAALKFAFEVLELEEVVAFTAVINKPSQLLMQRLGMSNTNEDFDHPMLDSKQPLAKHVLYKITRQQWRQAIAQ